MVAIPALPKRTTYVFGNGISLIFGVPHTNQLLSAWVGGHTPCDNLLRAIKYLYPGFNPKTMRFPPVEDLMGKLASGIDLFRLIEVRPTIRKATLALANREVRKLLLTRLWGITKQASLKESALRIFLKQLHQEDTIITLNWDALIERCLTDLGIPWAYHSAAGKIAVLKPHGSINWFRSRNLIPNLTRTIPGKNAFYACRNFSTAPPISMRLIDNCIIVPPTPTKTISEKGLQKAWNDAYASLRTAERVFCVGYSMPLNDDLVRLLLHRGHRYNKPRQQKKTYKFHVINPDEAVRERFESLVIGRTHGSEYEFHPLPFEQAVHAGLFQ